MDFFHGTFIYRLVKDNLLRIVIDNRSDIHDVGSRTIFYAVPIAIYQVVVNT